MRGGNDGKKIFRRGENDGIVEFGKIFNKKSRRNNVE